MEERKETHWKSFCNPLYIGAYSLNGKDLTVKITSIGQELVVGDRGKSEQCLVAHLEGQLPIILNRTNCKTITKLVGSPIIQKWIGKSITLYPTTTSVGGETVECLRIRPTLPTAKTRTELTPAHPKWADAVKFVQGGGDVAVLVKSYEVSDENVELLRKGI